MRLKTTRPPFTEGRGQSRARRSTSGQLETRDAVTQFAAELGKLVGDYLAKHKGSPAIPPKSISPEVDR